MKRILGAGFALATILAIPSIVTAQTNNRQLQNTGSQSISGQIVGLYDEDFILDSGTGVILVEAEDRPLRQVNFKVGERVTVNGYYDYDNSFDAISITRENGEVVQIFDD